MRNAKRHLSVYGCALVFFGLAVSGPVAEEQQEQGAAGYELEEGWRRLLEEQARAADVGARAEKVPFSSAPRATQA